MDRVGRGVAYTSPDEGVIVGMGGRSDVDVSSFGVASLSSGPPRREKELGRCLNDIRRRTRRNKVGSVVVASVCPSIGGSCTPNDLLGTAILSGPGGKEEGWRLLASITFFELCHLPSDRPAGQSIPYEALALARRRSLMIIAYFTMGKPDNHNATTQRFMNYTVVLSRREEFEPSALRANHTWS